MARSSRFRSVVALGALGLALAGCNIFVNVPKDLRGDVSVDLSNRLNANICEFSMTPRGYVGPAHNWIRTASVGPGSGRRFKVKPGDYRVVVSGCQHQYLGVAYLHLVAPTNLLVGFPGDTMADAYPSTLVPVAGRVARYVPPEAYYAAPVGGGEAAAGTGDDGGGDASSESSPDSSSESSESSSSSSESQPAASEHKDCLPEGAVTDNYHKCCDDSFQTGPSDQDRNYFVCG